jgi:hypothetical protein
MWAKSGALAQNIGTDTKKIRFFHKFLTLGLPNWHKRLGMRAADPVGG